MSTGFGIAQTSSGQGTDAPTLRRILGGKWENVGIVEGLKVAGRSDLYYSVAAGVAVASRSEADGCVELYYEGGNAGPVSAGDPSNPRIDIVWVKANDAQQGDGDNLVHVGVTEGTPSPSPSAPSAPAGCTVLSEHVMPAGATATNSATLNAEGYRAIPYGASLGLLLDLVDTANDDMTASYTPCSGKVRLPTDRYLSLKVTVTMAAMDGPWADGDGSVYCYLRVDGQNVDGRELRLRGGANAISNYYEKVVEVPEGEHTISLYFQLGVSKKNRKYWSANGWAGQCLQVLDIGPES